MNEREIQNALYRFLTHKGHWALCANIYLFCWESDFFSLRKSGYSCEYEIKISRSDFKADFKKTDKHFALQNGHVLYEHKTWHRKEDGKYEQIAENQPVKKSRPNYFWYVTPPGLIKPEEVPEYAGLMYAKNKWYCTEVKKPKLLHKEKYKQRWIDKILRSVSFKYWHSRIEPHKPITNT